MAAITKLESAITGLGLTPQAVLVNQDGSKVEGYMVVIKEAEDLVELMRRTHDLDVAFSPHPETDDVFVIWLR